VGCERLISSAALLVLMASMGDAPGTSTEGVVKRVSDRSVADATVGLDREDDLAADATVGFDRERAWRAGEGEGDGSEDQERDEGEGDCDAAGAQSEG
jgi:hypothetical protein